MNNCPLCGLSLDPGLSEASANQPPYLMRERSRNLRQALERSLRDNLALDALVGSGHACWLCRAHLDGLPQDAAPGEVQQRLQTQLQQLEQRIAMLEESEPTVPGTL
jgi:DNA repair exonuclease SbcCD ATPase subunit